MSELKDFPDKAPGCCFVCDNSEKHAKVKYIDTGRNFDSPYDVRKHGRIFICTNCIKDGAKLIGLVEEAALLVAQEAQREAEKVAFVYRKRVAHLATAVNAFDLADADKALPKAAREETDRVAAGVS
jgi:hypothetical protein